MNRLVIITIAFVIAFSCSLQADERVLDLEQNSHFFTTQNLNIYAQSDDDLNQGFNGFEDEDAGKRKSTTKAVLLSLAIPGMGEWYAGRKSRAVGFFLTEAGIWATYAFFKHKQGWLEDDYINFAIQHAQADPEGKDDHYFDMLGFYNNRDEYNKNSLVYSRENPYFPETSDWDWQWASDDLRQEYRDIKNSSKSQGRNANFVLGAALANRVVSAIDAWRSVKSYNRQFSPFFGKFQIELSPTFSEIVRGDTEFAIRLNFKHTF